MSKTHILIHIVFATKNRQPTIPLSHKRELYKYIYGIINNHRCFTKRINGMSEHIHLLIDLHPSVALADLIKKIKQSSTTWMKTRPEFEKFDRWGEGYYAFSVGVDEEEVCKNYIINQEEHHLGADFMEEIKKLSMAYHLDWDERDWR